jgi:hypothetical protein
MTLAGAKRRAPENLASTIVNAPTGSVADDREQPLIASASSPLLGGDHPARLASMPAAASRVG